MKKTIYVVMGESGDYEEHRSWTVCALATREEAEYYVLNVQAAYNEKKEKYDRKLRKWADSDGERNMPKFPKIRLDPFLDDYDSGGVRYSWQALQVIQLKKKGTPQ